MGKVFKALRLVLSLPCSVLFESKRAAVKVPCILQLELHCIVGDAAFRSNRMWGDVGDCMVRCVVVGVSLCVQETSRNSIAF